MDSSLGVLIFLSIVLGFADANIAQWCPFGNLPDTEKVYYLDKYCYQFVDKEKTFADANEYCKTVGNTYNGMGRLVTIPNQRIQNFLSAKLNSLTLWDNNGVWIGLNNRDDKDGWMWSDEKLLNGDPAYWQYWAYGEPKGHILNPFDCATMRREENWKWRPTLCGTPFYTYKFICRYPAKGSPPEGAGESEGQKGEQKSGSTTSTVAILLGVCGGLAFIVVLLVMLLLRRRRQQEESLKDATVMEALNRCVDCEGACVCQNKNGAPRPIYKGNAGSFHPDPSAPALPAPRPMGLDLLSKKKQAEANVYSEERPLQDAEGYEVPIQTKAAAADVESDDDCKKQMYPDLEENVYEELDEVEAIPTDPAI